MTSGVPWQVAGLRPRARETAQEAARRAGMSVGDWLDLAILQSARTEGVTPVQGGRNEDRPPEPDRDDGNFDDPAPWHDFSNNGERSPAPDASLIDIKSRLEALARQLDQVSKASPTPGAARPRRDDRTPRQIASTLSRLDRKRDHLSAERRSARSESDRRADDRTHPDPEPRRPAILSPPSPLAEALAEIAERQRILDGESALPRAGLPRAPTQGLGGLEQQLRSINARLETLHPNAIDSLRDSLAEISLMLKEATPREAIEALETEVRSLAQRTDSGRHVPDLAGLERGLAEVRDALRALTPAEQLAGLDEAVQALSRKIDGIAATTPDAKVLKQIECAIAELRDILSHVASNAALAKLTDEVRALAAKLDQAASADVLATLDQRIATIADALQSRAQSGEVHNLEALMLGLADKIEQLQLTRTDQAAFDQLEDRIAGLIEKLDTSDADHLETIERMLADMITLLGNQRAQLGDGEPVQPPDVDTLKRDVKRTQDSIEAVHGTLGHVVERLVTIESGIRRAQATAQPTPSRSAIQTMPFTLVTASATAPGNSARASDRHPIDPNLPPDHPLEPGLGASRGRGGNTPADRIAASEAALGPVRAPAIPHPGGKPDFIAAARRAAQAAGGEPITRGDKLPPDAPRGNRLDPASRPGGRMRKLLVGASVILIVLGTLQLLTGLFNISDDLTTLLSGQSNRFVARDSTISPTAAEETTEPPISAGRQAPLITGGIPFTTPGAGVLLSSEPDRPAAAVTPRPTSSNRAATGSIGSPSLAAAPPATALPQPPARPTGDKLPAAIGSGSLRTAASQGDPNAEFEVGVRFAEGRGVPQDLAAAADWFDRAAKRSLAPAQFRLGSLYEKGIGVKKDRDRARHLYLAAAQSGNAKAMHNLAVLYAEGIDGKPDYQTAAKWFRQAADHGMADSQYNLGVLYARGIGVEANLADAYKWFALAARSGDRESAKKRDEVGARLDQETAAAARAAVEAWTAEAQPEAATQVKTPAGGWDSSPAIARRDSGPDPKASRTTP